MLIYSIHCVCPSFIQQQIFLRPSNETDTLTTERSGVNKEKYKWCFHRAQIHCGNPPLKESRQLQHSCTQDVKLSLLWWKYHCLSVSSHNQKKSHHIQWVSVVFGGKVFYISDYCFGPFFRWLKILLVLSGENKNKKLYNRPECHVNFSATWDKWSSRSLFDVSVADRVFGTPHGWTAMYAL